MTSEHVTVVYKWTAKEGMLDQLTAIYQQVTEHMKANEPGADAVHIYVSEAENALYVRDEFKDANALGFHLQETASKHFGSLLEIATPGAFLFFGDVPQPIQEATKAMGLAAEFAIHSAGFERETAGAGS